MNNDAQNWDVKYPLRKWQEGALLAWKENNLRGIVSVVTGGGKTVFAFTCMMEVLKTRPEIKFIILVPTITLLDQWYASLQDDLGVEKDQIALHSGLSKSKTVKKVNIVVIDTARKILPSLKIKSEIFLVVDECHRAGSPINGKAIAGDYFATLGLSATPEREYDEGFVEFLKPTLGKIIFRYMYAEALRDKVICEYELRNVQVDLLEHEKIKFNEYTRRIVALKRSAPDALDAAKKLKTLLIRRSKVSANALTRLPVAAKIVEQNRMERTIIFHESIAAANQLYATLIKRNQSATIYHSKIAEVTRRDNLRLFRNGSYSVLVTCKALDEGMNAPETTLAIIASSTSSTRQRIQRLGRVLRPAPKKSKAIIYTLYATDQEKERLVSEFNGLSDSVQVKWIKSVSRHGEDIS